MHEAHTNTSSKDINSGRLLRRISGPVLPDVQNPAAKQMQSYTSSPRPPQSHTPACASARRDRNHRCALDQQLEIWTSTPGLRHICNSSQGFSQWVGRNSVSH